MTKKSPDARWRGRSYRRGGARIRSLRDGQFVSYFHDTPVHLRRYQVEGEKPGSTVILTWNQLKAANDPETMEEIREIRPFETTTLGMVDVITRVADRKQGKP